MKITVITKRAKKSRLATQAKKIDCRNILEVTFAETLPNKQWEEYENHENRLDSLLAVIDDDCNYPVAVWYRTATQGGRRKVFIKPLP